MSWSDDPVRDAENYQLELERTPLNNYIATVSIKVFLPCRGVGEDDAKEDAWEQADSLISAIQCLDGVEDAEIEKVRVKEE